MEAILLPFAFPIIVIFGLELAYWAWVNRGTLWVSAEQRKTVRICLFMVVTGLFVVSLSISTVAWPVKLVLWAAFAIAYGLTHRQLIHWMERRAEL